MSHRSGGTNHTKTLGAQIGLDALEESPAFQGQVEPIHDESHANGHYAILYETTEERLSATIPFVAQGLERGERCLIVVDDDAERTVVVDALRDSETDVDVDAAIEDESLVFYGVDETYLRNDEFDPDGMLEFYDDVIDDTTTTHAGLRVVADTCWLDDVSIEAFMEYEGRVNALFDEHDALAMCHYDRTELSPSVVQDVVQTHPHLVYDGIVCHNFYYVPPAELLSPDQSSQRTDRMLQTLRDRTRAKTELADHRRFLQRINEVMANPDRSFESKLRALFDLGCEYFDVDFAGLNRVDPAADVLEPEYLSHEHPFFAEGVERPLSETYCRAPADVMETTSVSDPAADGFDDIAVYDEYGAQAYLGTHIAIDGGDDRTFAFLASEPRTEPFSPDDRLYLELMAQWVKYELEREHQTEQLVALNNLYAVVHEVNRELAHQSTREEIEHVVCERLAVADSYANAWVADLDQIDADPTSAADAVAPGEIQVLDDLASSPTGDEPVGVTESDESTAMAAISVAHDDERYGRLFVTTDRSRAFDDDELVVLRQLGEIMGLAIAATEHERELEHERERLEFFNRLVRHNLLNSLNVVRARTGIVDGHVDDEFENHLDTIQTRADDMIDLIEALRGLMEAVLDRGEHELEPVDVEVVLAEEVAHAADSFDHAEFRVHGDLEDAGEVIADDLLGEVFENLLVNAVHHNDKAVPEVDVTVDARTDAVTVRIADNGPGISREMRDHIFEKGEKRFESPGTGFGLHLVREIVAVYDGRIVVEDVDPEGTAFAVTIPRQTEN